ncbi:hypothetical protein RCL_jg730.t1 [Rhizophagus clarus]|uniref:Uncharacterized protein n=1 Tax=Rhizophagus clarus TaxID=94130 RepID=A0A8H3LDV3_9GLOM|nr:hypothetical protein RCL_jg730.t1 [Rhizophagus clarus]
MSRNIPEAPPMPIPDKNKPMPTSSKSGKDKAEFQPTKQKESKTKMSIRTTRSSRSSSKRNTTGIYLSRDPDSTQNTNNNNMEEEENIFDTSFKHSHDSIHTMTNEQCNKTTVPNNQHTGNTQNANLGRSQAPPSM